MERFRLRILALDLQLPSLNVIGRGLLLCSAHIPASAKGEGYSVGWVSHALSSWAGSCSCPPRLLQSHPEIDLVSQRWTNLVQAREGWSRRRRSLVVQGAPRGRTADWSQVLPGSNQVKVCSFFGCCRQVELGREIDVSTSGKERRIRENFWVPFWVLGG